MKDQASCDECVSSECKSDVCIADTASAVCLADAHATRVSTVDTSGGRQAAPDTSGARVAYTFGGDGGCKFCPRKDGFAFLAPEANSTVESCKVTAQQCGNVYDWNLNCTLSADAAKITATFWTFFPPFSDTIVGPTVTKDQSQGCSVVPSQKIGEGLLYQCCFAPAPPSEPPCVADYGAKVGDRVCCHQPGPVESNKYICSKEKPYCLGYVRGEDKFGVPSGRCSAIHPVFPDFMISSASVTQQTCAAECEAAGRDFRFAGVENGHECFCGVSVPGDSKHLPAGACGAIPCAGNSSQACGGFNTLYAYPFSCPPYVGEPSPKALQ
ncbi:hypothetical protein CYMTET_51701 [Cymbomonas tetramitiformis]|uniref:WSC domain-containing protein n=1 Tax=Cymbomonas tetramitiformis TaxID=36881 RepID=A0AAE0BLS5_9CHLO|nr:hypothetical protein CYMTET_51701 [Cymbomonas tetramitiformis]